MEEKNIWKLLYVCYDMDRVLMVKQFLTILGQKGVVVKEKQFLDRLKICTKRPPIPPTTIDQCNAADLIVATMLEVLDISGYSDKFLEYALGWSETRQVAIFRDSRCSFSCVNC